MNCLIVWRSYAIRVVILPGTSVLMICPCIPDVREINCLVPCEIGSFFEALPSIYCHLFCKWQLIWPLNHDFSLFLHCTLNFTVFFNLLFSYFSFIDFPRSWAVLCAVASRNGGFFRLTPMGCSGGTENLALSLPVLCGSWKLTFAPQPCSKNLSFFIDCFLS